MISAFSSRCCENCVTVDENHNENDIYKLSTFFRNILVKSIGDDGQKGVKKEVAQVVTIIETLGTSLCQNDDEDDDESFIEKITEKGYMEDGKLTSRIIHQLIDYKKNKNSESALMTIADIVNDLHFNFGHISDTSDVMDWRTEEQKTSVNFGMLQIKQKFYERDTTKMNYVFMAVSSHLELVYEEAELIIKRLKFALAVQRTNNTTTATNEEKIGREIYKMNKSIRNYTMIWSLIVAELLESRIPPQLLKYVIERSLEFFKCWKSYLKIFTKQETKKKGEFTC